MSVAFAGLLPIQLEADELSKAASTSGSNRRSDGSFVVEMMAGAFHRLALMDTGESGDDTATTSVTTYIAIMLMVAGVCVLFTGLYVHAHVHQEKGIPLACPYSLWWHLRMKSFEAHYGVGGAPKVLLSPLYMQAPNFSFGVPLHMSYVTLMHPGNQRTRAVFTDGRLPEISVVRTTVGGGAGTMRLEMASAVPGVRSVVIATMTSDLTIYAGDYNKLTPRGAEGNSLPRYKLVRRDEHIFKLEDLNMADDKISPKTEKRCVNLIRCKLGSKGRPLLAFLSVDEADVLASGRADESGRLELTSCFGVDVVTVLIIFAGLIAFGYTDHPDAKPLSTMNEALQYCRSEASIKRPEPHPHEAHKTRLWPSC